MTINPNSPGITIMLLNFIFYHFKRRFEFQAMFPDGDKCKEYLAGLKWAQGYICIKCGHEKYCAGNGLFDRQYTSCNYVESPTAGTLLQQVPCIESALHSILYCYQ